VIGRFKARLGQAERLRQGRLYVIRVFAVGRLKREKVRWFIDNPININCLTEKAGFVARLYYSVVLLFAFLSFSPQKTI
jgi:hypothetical protein